MLRLELLKTKAELERGLEEFSLTCGRLWSERALGKRPWERGGSLVTRRTGAAWNTERLAGPYTSTREAEDAGNRLRIAWEMEWR